MSEYHNDLYIRDVTSTKTLKYTYKYKYPSFKYKYKYLDLKYKYKYKYLEYKYPSFKYKYEYLVFIASRDTVHERRCKQKLWNRQSSSASFNFFYSV